MRPWGKGAVTVIAVLFLCISTIPIAVDGGSDEPNPLIPEDVSSNQPSTDATTETVVVRFADSLEPAHVDSTTALQANAQTSQQPFVEAAAESPYVDVRNSFWIANALLVEYDSNRLSEADLTAVQHVTDIHPNFEVNATSEAHYTPSLPSHVSADETNTRTTYGLDMINAPKTWDRYNTQGEGVGVAVLDSGVDPDHVAINAAGWAEFDWDGNWVDSEPYDDNGHGTHVAGTVAGNSFSDSSHTDENLSIGVAPEADLYGVKVLGEDGVGSWSQIIAGMEWATANNNHIDILQMSLGSEGYSSVYIEPVENARSVGQAVSVSIGNYGPETSGSPGNLYSTLGTGAVDANQDVTSFSSGEVVSSSVWGLNAPHDWPDEYTVPDVTAPGQWVVSAEANSDTGTATTSMSGTSMAAPHTAGTVALMMSATDNENEITVQDIEAALRSTANHPDGPDAVDTRYGHGTIDSYSAIAAVRDTGFVSGQVTAADTGEPLSEIPIESATGEQTTTNDTGHYSLEVATGEQTITANGSDWVAETTGNMTIDNGEVRTDLDLALDRATNVTVISDDPAHTDPMAAHELNFAVAAVNTYNVTVAGQHGDGSALDADAVTLTHDGTEIDPDVPLNVTDDSFYISVTSATDTIGTIKLNHTFKGHTENVSLSTTTHVHPDPIQIPQDISPDTIQTVVDIAYNNTTIMLDSTPVHAEHLQHNSTSIHIDRPLTIKGADGQATLSIENASAPDTPTGITVGSHDVRLESIRVTGDVHTGIAVHESNLTAIDLNVNASKQGLAITDTANTTVAHTNLTNASTGVVVAGSDHVNLTATTVTAADTAVNLTAGTTTTQVTESNLVAGDLVFETVDPDTTTIDTQYHQHPLTVSATGTTIAPADEPASRADYTSTSPFYTVTHTNDAATTHLSVNYTITHPVGVSEDSLQLYQFAGNNADWTSLNTTLDQDAQTATTTVTNLPESTTIGAYAPQVPYIAVPDLRTVDTIHAGDRADVFATVENQGKTVASDTIKYRLNDTVVAHSNITIAPNAQTTVVLPYNTTANRPADTYEYAVQTMNDSATGNLTVNNTGPRADIAANATFDEQLRVNETGTVTTTLENTGDAAGTAARTLSVGNTTLVDDLVYLNATETATTNVTMTRDTTGTYTVNINNVSAGTINVVAPNITTDVQFTEQVNVSEAVAVTVNTTNTGGAVGNLPRHVRVHNTTIVNDTISVDPNETISESFREPLDVAGQHAVLLNNRSQGIVDVHAPHLTTVVSVPDEPEVDDIVPVEITLNNTGSALTFDRTLTIDNTMIADDTVHVDANDTHTDTFEYRPTDSGTYNLSVSGTHHGTVTVSEDDSGGGGGGGGSPSPEPDVQITELSVPTVTELHNNTVTVVVENFGNADADQNISFQVANQDIYDTTQVTLAAGEQMKLTEELHTAKLAPGNHSLSVASVDDTADTSMTITPALVDFDVQVANLTTANNTTITVPVTVEHTGETNVTDVAVTIQAADYELATDTLPTVDAGDTTQLNFTNVSTDQLEPGTFTLNATVTHDAATAFETAELEIDYETTTADFGTMLLLFMLVLLALALWQYGYVISTLLRYLKSYVRSLIERIDKR